MGLRCRACQRRTLELNHGLARRLPRLRRDTLTQLLRNRIIPKCKDRDLYKYKQLVFIINYILRAKRVFNIVCYRYGYRYRLLRFFFTKLTIVGLVSAHEFFDWDVCLVL